MAAAMAGVLALLGLAALPAAAGAHARLESTSPPQGAVVKRQPGAVVFRFDEPVEGNFGAVRVYGSAGERADEGDAFHPDDDGRRLGVHLRPDLADGSYTATYRVVSADGHIVSSGYVFSIGKAGAAPRESVAALVAGGGTGPITELAFGVAKGLEYLAIGLALGAVAFLLAVWGPAVATLGARAPGAAGQPLATASAALLARARRLLAAAALVGALAAAASVVLEGAEAAGLSGFGALRETVVRETLAIRYGTVWALAVLAWLSFAALLALLGRRRGRLLLLVPLAYLVLCPALSGHPSTQAPVPLNFALNVVHVVAMGVWFGGLASLLVLLPAATRSLPGGDRTPVLAGVLGRFSPLALAMVATVALSGLVQAYVYVGEPAALLESGYGRAVLAKLVLLAMVLAFAAYNRRRSLPRLRRRARAGVAPGRPGLLARRALRAEAALLVVVFAVTAALASYAPPSSARLGPFSASGEVGPTRMEVTVDPARVGANRLHLYFFDARTGAQYTRGKEVTASATLPGKAIGPLPLALRRAGPGHYIAANALLNAPGEWRLVIALRVSAFDEYSRRIEVPVR